MPPSVVVRLPLLLRTPVRVYTFGVMVNRSYDVTFSDHFDLVNFPFDSQALIMDLGLNNQHKGLFDLSVHVSAPLVLVRNGSALHAQACGFLVLILMLSCCSPIF
jgi:hypothetical protein